MPLCVISQDVSLHYITNSPRGDVTDIDRTKPTILLIPPIFCDVTWLREQFGDTRLSCEFNLIAFDQRNMGQTRAPPSPKRDSWVDAADAAMAHELLQLPPCHVFATSINSCGAALRLAILFPTKCLSLCLCAVPTQAGEDPDWVVQGYLDMLDGWCFPQDLDALERACIELSWFMFSGQISSELEDEVVAWWQVNLPPTNRSNYLAQGLCANQRTRLSDQELASIQQPTLLIQGDKSLQNPPNRAYELSEKLPNSRVFVVKGGPEFMSVVPEYASIVNRIYFQFLSDFPSPPVFQPSQPDPEHVFKVALERLAIFANDALVAKRSTNTTLSFSLLLPAVVEKNTELFTKYAEGEKEAFHALNEYGRPIRKLSERHMEQWTPDILKRTKPIVPAVKVSSVSTQEEGNQV